ncbi:MAG: divalent-cation tolerance protein CutA [Candidatus Omnitrophota bacterium]|nr:divalent-cation tolerance protein CutA [Candidatus Omnitrophota bacterium]
MKNIVIFITAGSRAEARKIAKGLVEKRLAACVNIVPDIESVYTWKGKTEAAREVLLIAKTKENLFARIEKAVKGLHSYECPEIIAISIVDGSRDYLKWIEESTT